MSDERSQSEEPLSKPGVSTKPQRSFPQKKTTNAGRGLSSTAHKPRPGWLKLSLTCQRYGSPGPSANIQTRRVLPREAERLFGATRFPDGCLRKLRPYDGSIVAPARPAGRTTCSALRSGSCKGTQNSDEWHERNDGRGNRRNCRIVGQKTSEERGLFFEV